MRGELAPSIISADQATLGQDLKSVESSASRWHVDVMDGHYVPNLTIGPSMVEAIGRISDLPQDVHLMITNPDETWTWYAKAGAARIAVHPETSPDVAKLLTTMQDGGVVPGVAVNPDVPTSEIVPFLDRVGFLIVMSVYPGFSGQSFIPGALAKLAEFRKLVDDRDLPIQLIVDGGVNDETGPACVDAGADVLVSASAIFGADDPPAVAKRIAAMWDNA